MSMAIGMGGAAWLLTESALTTTAAASLCTIFIQTGNKVPIVVIFEGRGRLARKDRRDRISQFRMPLV
ncbi:hypothetical protein N7516_009794 [Penicillium verrucosum]|uniref:uncharacterized protein n=1 Tax=Penicillium verrucosum TaxID=60171 RepID=UPI0025455837|nr:uncharacterized protein N7516_009794 [Penicillium verrucosum]KAJ5922091.1 hypothetical protein N7516_009794 [Penicillium verrucosum]